MSAKKVWILPYILLIWYKKLNSLAQRVWRKLTGRRRDDFDTALPREIPRKIWVYWDTGEDTAPPLVKACIASWRDKNPGWEVTVIDGSNLETVVDMPIKPGVITVQAYSDLLRLRLLRRFGGVWVDATAYCQKPLDDWLPVVARRGFFIFVWDDADSWLIWPNVRRIATTWFLASEPDGAMVSAWEARSFAYWEDRKTAHDYYWVHMIFEYLTLTSRSFRRNWKAMPKLGAYGPHIVHDHVVQGRDPQRVRAALDSGAVPLQKLRWNWPEPELARVREVLDILPEGPTPADSSQTDPLPVPDQPSGS